MNSSFMAFVVLAVLSPRIYAQANISKCSDWQNSDRQAESCSCNGAVLTGDDRSKACVQSFLNVDPAATIGKESKFGIHGLTTRGGYLNGVDGSGQGESIGVEFFHAGNVRKGILRAEAEIGSYKMGGLPFTNQQNVGQVSQLADGTPVNGTIYTQGRGPAGRYLPLGRVSYEPPMPKVLAGWHPYGVAEIGFVRVGPNATADSKLASTINGQVVSTQDLGTSLQPTDSGINHPGGGLGGGVRVDLGKTGFSAGVEVIRAPTGYNVYTSELKWTLHRNKRKAADAILNAVPPKR